MSTLLFIVQSVRKAFMMVLKDTSTLQLSENKRQHIKLHTFDKSMFVQMKIIKLIRFITWIVHILYDRCN